MFPHGTREDTFKLVLLLILHFLHSITALDKKQNKKAKLILETPTQTVSHPFFPQSSPVAEFRDSKMKRFLPQPLFGRRDGG